MKNTPKKEKARRTIFGNITKKTKMVEIGTKELLDPETGELMEFSLIRKNVHTDYNFHKIWVQDLLNILNSFGNKKIKILSYLLGKMRNEDNTVSVTYRKIEKDTGISKATIVATMRELIEAGVLKKIQIGTYQFNPALIVKGGSGKRKMLLVEYYQLDEAAKVEDYWEEAEESQEIKEVKGEIINE